MKRIVCFLLLIISLLAGCTDWFDMRNESDAGQRPRTDVSFFELEQANFEEWDAVEFPIDIDEFDSPAGLDRVTANDDAIKLGEAILAHQQKNHFFLDYCLCSITHYSRDNIWLFEYSTEDLLPGSVAYVVIDGSNLRIIKAWAEE